jgi:hypothetical protein
MDVPSGNMRDNIMPLPYKEPSQVLAALLNQIIEEGRKFAGAVELQTSDMSAQAPVGTTLAILERQLKTMSAVQARIHYAMRQEFKLLKNIIRDYTPPEYAYEPEEGGRSIKQSDYDQVDVIPVSDPNAATMAQKVVQYQAALQLAQTAPQLYDLPLLHRQMLDVLGIKNYQKLVPMADDMKPRDPVTENMNILRNKPVKAFIYQDHQAHIAVHMSAMQDPKVQSIVGMNPQMAQALQAAMMAHVFEHLGMEYRKQVEQTMGQTLPPFNEEQDEVEMSPEMEIRVSQMAAQASQQLLQQNMQQAKQQKNQQMAQDPLIQMQQAELQLKAQDLQRKTQKDMSDAQLKAEQINVEKERIDMQMQAEGAKLMAKAVSERDRTKATQESEGFRIMSEVDKQRRQLEVQRELANRQAQNKPPKKGE